MGLMKLYLLFTSLSIWLLMAGLVASNVVLMGNNVTLTFNDVEANFAPAIKGSGICGTIYASDPLDACNSLSSKPPKGQTSPFVLIIRGNCTFDDKVRNAQNAGYKAAIIFDNEDNNPLVSMAGSSAGIHIYAVFISHSAGQTLTRYTNRTDLETWIIPTFSNSAWSIMAISFISILAMSAVLATCFFVRRHRIRRERRPSREEEEAREFHGMSSQLVRAMPSVVFTALEDEKYCTGFTCSICLEDYSLGDRLRLLPCKHKFHAICVDMWLTSWRTFCPVCKRDARANSSFHNPPPTETTPLLSSPSGSSLHSILSSSSSIRVSSLPPRSQSQSVSRVYTTSRIPNRNNRLSSSFNNDNNNTGHHSPQISISRSYADFRAVSSFHSYRGGPNMMTSSSPYQYGSPMIMTSSPHHRYGSPMMTISSSPLHRYGSHMVASSSQMMMSSSSYYGYGSPYTVVGSSMGSSDRQSYLRHCDESGTSLSEMASAQSLPDC